MKAINPILRMLAALIGVFTGAYVGARTMQISALLTAMNGREHVGPKWETLDMVIMGTVLGSLAVLMTNLFILDEE